MFERTLFRIAVIFAPSFIAVGGCSTLSSIDYLTMGKSAREQELQSVVEKFSRAYYWGDSAQLAQYVEPGQWRLFTESLRRQRSSERLVDLHVDSISFDDDSFQAQVYVQARYFKQPTYLVQKRLDRQTWKFSRVGGGWKLHGLRTEREDGIDYSGGASHMAFGSRDAR